MTTLIPTWTLGEKLRKCRDSLGITQEAMAELLDVNAKTLASWEADVHTPTKRAFPGGLVALAQRYEALTDIPAGWILGLGSASG